MILHPENNNMMRVMSVNSLCSKKHRCACIATPDSGLPGSGLILVANSNEPHQLYQHSIEYEHTPLQ